ncbi:3',5'-cyclic-nucleotide phosphodiesterase [Aureococcus anophagefferens]|nr:3',5'-cyclic-nucleotide phosphodiesterase [Aureococcus anophagefferens]
MPDASLGLSNEIMLEMGHYETFVLNDARPPATYRPDARDERRRKKHWQRTRIRAFESAGEAMIQFLRTMKDYPAEDGGGDGAGGVLTTGKLLGRLLQVAMRSAPENGGIFGNFGGVAPSDIVTVWLHEPKDGVLYTRWASKLPANIKKNARDYIKIKDGDGMAGAAFAAAAPSNTPDARMDPNYSDRVDRTTGYVTRSVLTLPFGAPGTAPIGVAQFINRVWSPDADEDSDADSEDDEGHATSSVLPFADPEADARVRVDETAFKIDDLAMPEHVETLAVRDGDATRAIHVIPYSARDEAAMTGLVDLFACVLTYAIEYHEARRGVAPGGDFTCLNDLVESKETSRIGIWTKRAREILFNRKSDEDEAAKVDDSDDEDEADSVGRAAASRRATNRGTISEFLTRSTSTFGRRESQRALLDRAPDEPAPQKPAHLQRQGGANREGARRSSISKFFAKKAADKADAPAGPPRGSQRRTSLSKFFAKNDGGAAPAAAPTADSPPAPLRRRGSLFAKEDVNPNKTTVENGKIRHTFSNQATLEVADVANTPQSPPRRL